MVDMIHVKQYLKDMTHINSQNIVLNLSKAKIYVSMDVCINPITN